MGILQDLNIIRGNATIAGGIFEDLFPSFMHVDYNHPSQYIAKYWDAYLKARDNYLDNAQQARKVNGDIFEYIIATLLIREKIHPFYFQAKVAFVPNITFDLLLYSSDRGPISLSAKTSFRERYKQADLEAFVLKNVHRKSQCFLITLSEQDAISVNKKQERGDIIGLNEAILATGPDFDQLINDLKKLDLVESPKVEVIQTNQMVNEATIKSVFPNPHN